MAAQRATVRGSWTDVAPLHRFVVQHWKLLVYAAPRRFPVSVFPHRSESRQPRVCRVTDPVAVNSERIGNRNGHQQFVSADTVL